MDEAQLHGIRWTTPDIPARRGESACTHVHPPRVGGTTQVRSTAFAVFLRQMAGT